MADINLKIDIPVITKMWETLDERGIATWLNPWRIKREGFANTEVEVNHLLEMSRAQRTIERESQLNSALVCYSPSGRIEPHIDLVQLVEEERKVEFVRQQTNLGKSIIQAENELAGVKQSSSDTEVDADWLYQWRNSAREFSSEYMQELWGKILAGEFSNPGCFSYNTLDVVKKLNKEGAAQFLKVASLCSVWEKRAFVYQDQNLNKKFDLYHIETIELEENGLLTASEGTITIKGDFYSFFGEDKFIRIRNLDENSKPHITLKFLTTAGYELLNIIDVEPKEEYFKEFGRSLLNKFPVEVTIGKLKRRNADGSFDWDPELAITLKKD